MNKSKLAEQWIKIRRKGLGEIPQIASENIKAPENAPGDKRISGRTEQMNLKVSKEFKRRLKIRAAEERCLMVEVLERALEIYERQSKNRTPKKT